MRARDGRTRAFGRKIFPCLLLLCALPACGDFLRILKYGPSQIDDFTIFPGRAIRASTAPFHFRDRRREILIPSVVDVPGAGHINLDAFIRQSRTVAFLVIHGTDLVYERYFRGYARESLVQIFSVSKSVTSLLVGKAIAGGKFRDVHQPVTEIVPELRGAGYTAVTIDHLLQMTSGMDYCESDNPFGVHPAMYYTEDMMPLLLGLTLKTAPGTEHVYKSGDTQLLGLMLSRVVSPGTIAQYAGETLWEPLGMEYDALWATDKPGGLEKTFCCLSLRAIDLAKIGALVARGGMWNGTQIIPRQWMDTIRVPDVSRGGSPVYSHGWWLFPDLPGGVMGLGHLGQYLIILPESDLVIVRLGMDGSEDLRREYARLAVALSRVMPLRQEDDRPGTVFR